LFIIGGVNGVKSTFDTVNQHVGAINLIEVEFHNVEPVIEALNSAPTAGATP
jgi:nicotinate-nucleotide pyrophosphorylase